MLNAFDKQEKKAKSRQAKVPKPVVLKDELTRLSGLKWNSDILIFREVERALLLGELMFPGRKMKKDDIYQGYAVLQRQKREALKQKVRESKPSNYYIVQDLKTWTQMQRLLFQEDEVAWDTETTGLDFFEDRVVGVSAYLPIADVAFYVPFGHTTGEKQILEDQALAPIKEWLEDVGNRSIWHNYKFDAHMLACHGILVANPYFDTQVAAKLLNEHEVHKLKVLYEKYVAQSGEVVLFEDIIDAADIANTDVLLAGVYAAGDPHKTYGLYKFQKKFIDTVGNVKNIFHNIEMKLLPIDVRIERLGVLVNVPRLNEIEQAQLPLIAQAEEDLKKSFNIDADFLAAMSAKKGRKIDTFNFGSDVHVAYLIYDILQVGLDVPKRFGKKAGSTAAEVIDAIVADVPQLEPLLKYRELSKLVNTYAHKIPLALEADGRLHSQFDSSRTRTGRYASSEYGNKGKKKGTNLQNIPSRTELGKEVRKCLIPDPGYLFVSSDLSQIEPRVIAHILYAWFGDSSMRDVYLAGVDLYTTMAMQVFDLPQECCIDGGYDPVHTYQPRKLMKTGLLGYLYGQSAKSFANKMGVEMEVAEKFFAGMASRFPGLKPFREKVLAQLKKDRFAETLFGRKRRFPEYAKLHAQLQVLNRKPWGTLSQAESEERNFLWRKCAGMEREAINAVVQGSAADILKQIIIKMDGVASQRRWKYVMSIHDELLLLIPKADVTPEAIQVIDDVMTKTVELTVPLKCDTVIQERWMDEVKPKDWDFKRGCRREAA